jgi:hypothetical protein
MTLQNAGSTNPMAPQRRTSMASMGRTSVENPVDPRNLIEEEVSMRNYPLKLRN